MATDQHGEAEPAKATRRRGQALEHAILHAAAQQLAEGGYPNLTMDAVAARAATSKNVIYRRWPNRAALGVAAYRQMLDDEPHGTPDTGNLRADALALLTRVNDRMSSPAGKVLRELLTGIQNDPDRMREIRDQLANAAAAAWLTILARAAARREISSKALVPRVATAAVDLLRNEYAVNGLTKAPASTLTEIVDQVFLPLLHAYR